MVKAINVLALNGGPATQKDNSKLSYSYSTLILFH